jgi:hypothetical protein
MSEYQPAGGSSTATASVLEKSVGRARIVLFFGGAGYASDASMSQRVPKVTEAFSARTEEFEVDELYLTSKFRTATHQATIGQTFFDRLIFGDFKGRAFSDSGRLGHRTPGLHGNIFGGGAACTEQSNESNS